MIQKATKIVPPHLRERVIPPSVEQLVKQDQSAADDSHPDEPRSRQLDRGFTDEQVERAVELAEGLLPSIVGQAAITAAAKARQQNERWTVDSNCSPRGAIPVPTIATDEQCQNCVVRKECLIPAIRTTEEAGVTLEERQWAGNFGGTTREQRAEIARALNAMEES